MLRIDAEENSAPAHVVTLTTRDEVSEALLRRAHATFWQAFRRRWGAVEYCGFREWTTGTAPRSGGRRRPHWHYLVKGLVASDVAEVEAWVSAEWRKLVGAWRVQVAELRTVGGVVGYLALHHEKMAQAPPRGWTGRRLLPSKGYFAVPADVRRARARLWLGEHRDRARAAREGREAPVLPPEPPRMLWRTSEAEKAARELIREPGRPFDSLPARRERDRLLLDPIAPIHDRSWDAAQRDHEVFLRRYRYRELMRARAQSPRLLSGRRKGVVPDD